MNNFEYWGMFAILTEINKHLQACCGLLDNLSNALAS